MRILWVGTKPPWPPLDGGRLVAASSIEALAAGGHDVTVLTPSLGESATGLLNQGPCTVRAVPARPRSWLAAATLSLARHTPVSIVRHSVDAVRREVASLVGAGRFDVVHAEQLQALPQCEPALRASIPVVLRAQNVESELWAGGVGAWPRWITAIEARGLARWEAGAVRAASAVVALTPRDAALLRVLSGREPGIHCVRPPWPAELPPAKTPLEGSPAVVLLGSASWRPNREGAEWFLAQAWTAVRRTLPDARLHAFGLASRSGDGVVFHAPPTDSREAFPHGAVHVVPLRTASGIRVRILEAWARGVPVVCTPTAAEGLDGSNGEHLLLAETSGGFAEAIRRLYEDPGLGTALVAAGRRRLETDYEPARVTDALVAVYRSVLPAQA